MVVATPLPDVQIVTQASTCSHWIAEYERHNCANPTTIAEQDRCRTVETVLNHFGCDFASKFMNIRLDENHVRFV